MQQKIGIEIGGNGRQATYSNNNLTEHPYQSLHKLNFNYLDQNDKLLNKYHLHENPGSYCDGCATTLSRPLSLI